MAQIIIIARQELAQFVRVEIRGIVTVNLPARALVDIGVRTQAAVITLPGVLLLNALPAVILI